MLCNAINIFKFSTAKKIQEIFINYCMKNAFYIISIYIFILIIIIFYKIKAYIGKIFTLS